MMKGLRTIIFLLLLAGLWACGEDRRYGRAIELAEQLMETRPDSALKVLAEVQLPERLCDSLRAKFFYVKGYCDLKRTNSMVADSLIDFSRQYYCDKDSLRLFRCEMVYAWRQFWIGNTDGAIILLDSLSHLPNIADSARVQPLRIKMMLECSQYNGQPAVDAIHSLMAIDTDEHHQLEYRYLLAYSYIFANKPDSALAAVSQMQELPKGVEDGSVLRELIHAVALGEAGRAQEAIAMFDDILCKSPGNAAEYSIHIYKAQNLINSNQIESARRELAIADSLYDNPNPGKKADHAMDIFRNLLHTILDYKATGRINSRHMAMLSNREEERFNRMAAAQYESEKSAMNLARQSLALKLESERKTVAILLILLLATLSAGVAIWIYRMRKRRLIEAEENAETLAKMVEELKSESKKNAASDDREKLRRILLNQLGIIKMVAETPTAQNREMLRRFTASGSDSLVNWPDVYSIIDTLHNGFYTRLKEKYGAALTEKEIQIAVLLIAGFSTKEIAVITQ